MVGQETQFDYTTAPPRAAKEKRVRTLRKTGLACAVVLFGIASAARGGQPININALPAGTRFCPAPGADNSDFMQSYFAIDAQTGQMTRHGPDTPGIDMGPEPMGEEVVLFVAPPVSVESIYVPPPGGSPVPPRTMATGVLPQTRPQPQPVRYAAPQQTYPQQQQAYAQLAQPAYAQPQPARPYPQQTYAQPAAYARPTEYAQTQPYPQPYPQPYVQPAAYARPAEYAQTQPYPQPYPQPYAQPMAYAQPTVYAQTQPYPQPYAAAPASQPYPQPAAYAQPRPHPQAQPYPQYSPR